MSRFSAAEKPLPSGHGQNGSYAVLPLLDADATFLGRIVLAINKVSVDLRNVTAEGTRTSEQVIRPMAG